MYWREFDASYKEKRPPKNKPVIARCKKSSLWGGGHYVCLAVYNRGGGMTQVQSVNFAGEPEYADDNYYLNVTHWMPLPLLGLTPPPAPQPDNGERIDSDE